MAIANSNLPTLTNRSDKHRTQRGRSRWQLLRLPRSLWVKFWWHSTAYSVILAIMLLTGLSLAGLWLFRLVERSRRAVAGDRKSSNGWQNSP